MIGKQVKGKSFRGVLNYLHEKEQAQRIGGNMAGNTPRVLSAEFRVARELNPQLEKAVYHASLSLPKDEQLDDDRWNAIADDYVKGMGFEGSQYVVYRHGDREHDHIHIVASRIRITDGSTVSDSWDYPRSEKLIRSLEKQYDLTPAPPSAERESKASMTGEIRRYWRTGDPGVRGTLLAHIDQAAEGSSTMPEFMEQLQAGGISARVKITRTGKARGISYEVDGVAFSGTKLGKAYTFPGLQKYRDIVYQPEMNNRIEALSQRPPESVEPQVLNPLEGQQSASILSDLLDYLEQSEFQGNRYTVCRQANNLVLTRQSSGEILMNATRDDDQEWQLKEPPRLSEADLKNIQRTGAKLQQERAEERERQRQQRQRQKRRQKQRQRSREQELEL